MSTHYDILTETTESTLLDNVTLFEAATAGWGIAEIDGHFYLQAPNGDLTDLAPATMRRLLILNHPTAQRIQAADDARNARIAADQAALATYLKTRSTK